MKNLRFYRNSFLLLTQVIMISTAAEAGMKEVIDALKAKGLYTENCNDIYNYPEGTFCFTTPSISLAYSNIFELRAKKPSTPRRKSNDVAVFWFEVEDEKIFNLMSAKNYTLNQLEKSEGSNIDGVELQKSYLSYKNEHTISDLNKYLHGAPEGPIDAAWNFIESENATANAIATMVSGADFRLRLLPIKLKHDGDRTSFSDILSPYNTRVKFKGSDGFIHANFTKIKNGGSYIATQAPKIVHFPEFWKMIYEQKSPIIVNLTKKGEVPQYMFGGVGKQIQNDFEIVQLLPNTVHMVQGMPAWEESIYRISRIQRESEKQGGMDIPEENERPHTVTVVHYLNWQDQKDVNEIKELDSLIKRVDKLYQVSASDNPITVHCRAGVGRTGTFIARRELNHRRERDNTIDVLLNGIEIVREIRAQRGYASVQKLEQFKMIFQVPSQTSE